MKNSRVRAHPSFALLLTAACLGPSAACTTEPSVEKPPAPALVAVVETPARPGPPKRLFARKFVSRIRSGPSVTSPQLGYLRSGTVLTAKTDAPIGFDRCRRGWYEIADAPGGFVCDGREVTAFDGSELPDRQPTFAARMTALPYRYAYNRKPGTPMYKRLPTEDEALFWEDGVLPADAGLPEGAETPDEVDAGAPARKGPSTLEDLRGDKGALVRRRLNQGFHVSLDREFDTGKRRYWRSMSNGYIPYERMVLVEGSSFHGVADPIFPLAFIIEKEAAAQRESASGRLVAAGPIAYHSVFPIAAQREIKRRSYVVTPEGLLVRAQDVVRVEAAARPHDIGPDEAWIDIDLERQTLVAYRGDRPVYVTLVSTGRVRNERNAALNNETPAGRYRILSKHVSATMDGDHAIFGAYSLEDVPYVQFFQGAFALHGAFWHDKFGRPASHGCINLAPEDARWLFDWTAPIVPDAWHAAYPPAGQKGTWLIIHGKTPRG